MPDKYRLRIVLYILLLPAISFGQGRKNKSFHIVPLGVLGGIDESNLSAYMVAAPGTNDYICLDAGTLHYGIEKAVSNGVFSIPAEEVLRRYIKGYFISHAHLDHIAGLIINSPDDTSKTIYALGSTIETIKKDYFTWESWANFADDGEAPTLKKYHYQVLVPDNITNIKNTAMTVKVFPLSHSNLTSTAFLIQNSGSYILYLGDTGADEIEKSDDMQNLWLAVAPLIKAGKLKAIMIETSFPDEQPHKTLFGHLTPELLMKEMHQLAGYAGGSLNGLDLIITHLKPPAGNIVKIKAQLKAENDLRMNIIFPQQGRAIDL